MRAMQLLGRRRALRPVWPDIGCRRARLVVNAWQQGASTGCQQPNKLLKASLDKVYSRYLESTPSAVDVSNKVFKQGYGESQVIHDHFAFRTFGVPGLGLEHLGAAFEAFGYTRQDYYIFPRTHLLAAWYAPPKHLYEQLPRIFISQLQVEKLSPVAQSLIHSYTDDVTDTFSGLVSSHGSSSGSTTGGSNSSSFGSSGNGSHCSSAAMLNAWTSAVTGVLPWGTPKREDYLKLLEESEYGAWVLVNGYGLNHTALSVHQIHGHQGDIYAFANELVMKGFNLNDSGGIMKVCGMGHGVLTCGMLWQQCLLRIKHTGCGHA
eukprot:GHRR01032107.1.p1 GENE.GHRR01032107.1~~GHRR01032107.1.p1  ORF type:complete len:320 (+),score=85.73 GHRR01032107.1:227-1186(+)